jgi:hypothetical protein
MPAAQCGRLFFEALPADKVFVLAIRSHRVRRVFAMRSSSGRDGLDAMHTSRLCPVRPRKKWMTRSTPGKGFRMRRRPVRGSSGELRVPDGRKFLLRRVVVENDFSGLSFIYWTGRDHLDMTRRNRVFFWT